MMGLNLQVEKYRLVKLLNDFLFSILGEMKDVKIVPTLCRS